MNSYNSKKIVVFGTIFMDIKGYPEGPFSPKERNAGKIIYKYGGVGRNVAANIAGLGLHPIFVSLADPDGHGASIVEHLKSIGVNTDYILRSKEGIGTWMVIFDQNGEVSANLSKRQVMLPLVEHIRKNHEAVFKDADGLLLEMDMEEQLIEEIFSYADKYCIPIYGVISNMTIAKERMKYIRKTKCFFCNRSEMGILFDIDTLDKDQEELLSLLQQKLKEEQMKSMFVTMDKDGAVYASLEYPMGSGTYHAIKRTIVDTTGAGDAFFSGASAALIRGLSMKEACELGTEMAADVISTEENYYCI